MPIIAPLPDRGNTITFDPDEVREYADLLVQASENENGVGMDENQPTENKARMRGKRLAELIEARYGVKPRVHIGKTDDEFSVVLSVKGDDAGALEDALSQEDADQEDADQEDADNDTDDTA